MSPPRLGIPAVASLVAVLCVAPGSLTRAQEAPPTLTREAMREFLLTAKVVKSIGIGKGVTRPVRLTLSDGTLTHDAAFQGVDERKVKVEFAAGGREVNFVDSFHFNIAAYEVSGLLGLQDMMPVTVERRWQGRLGSWTWWIDAMMDEQRRLDEKITPPDVEAWNRQIYRMRAFAELVADTDRNLGNVLITHDWSLVMIDFTRAFRLSKQVSVKGLPRCDRRLLDAMRNLDADAVERVAGKHLSKYEVQAMMARRDAIVAHFDKLVAEKGEAAVLY